MPQTFTDTMRKTGRGVFRWDKLLTYHNLAIVFRQTVARSLGIGIQQYTEYEIRKSKS